MSQGGLPAVVFDTRILDQATASLTGPAAELLRRLEAGQFLLDVSAEILNEAHDILSRPKLRTKNPRVTDETVRETLDLLDRLATHGLGQSLHSWLKTSLHHGSETGTREMWVTPSRHA